MEIFLILVIATAVGIYTYAKAKKNSMAQAIGATIMPGLFFGALVWCLFSGNFDIIIVDIAIVGILLAYLNFGLVRSK